MVSKWQRLMLVVAATMLLVMMFLPGVTVAAVEWNPDGVISENEYDSQQQIGEVLIFTRIKGREIMMAVQAKTGGYISLGIDPEQFMKGADIIMMYVKDGKTYVEDMYSIGNFGPHPADTAQGGRQDIQVFGGSEAEGITTVEFKRKLNTGDKKDKPLKKGDNKIIWAIGYSDDITMKHIKRGSGTLVL